MATDKSAGDRARSCRAQRCSCWTSSMFLSHVRRSSSFPRARWKELRAVVRSGRLDPRQPRLDGFPGSRIRLVEHSVDAARDRVRIKGSVAGDRHYALRDPEWPIVWPTSSRLRGRRCVNPSVNTVQRVWCSQATAIVSLWTDDAMVAVYGTHELGIRRVWTQVVLSSPSLHSMKNRG